MTTKKTWLYLEWLRRSGQTNMFGAVPYLMNTFLMDWMQNYNPDDYPEVIKIEDFN